MTGVHRKLLNIMSGSHRSTAIYLLLAMTKKCLDLKNNIELVLIYSTKGFTPATCTVTLFGIHVAFYDVLFNLHFIVMARYSAALNSCRSVTRGEIFVTV